ncbi:hypothetical protein [Photorhabdus luminescens]|uniref:hypothetical protein n=1 Tax=Photorhabdus luminescens TaxID=29488 RepID=UPI00223EAE02|nr:hypothetical protein [Photorhabdus luminescens]MCW7764453.1 hypothetical protein [Photorhabdus luminescens subsp. venezuelensis]
MDKPIPAFPTQNYEYDGQYNVLQYDCDGMTLRDYFAAKAMSSIVLRDDNYSEVACEAYDIADAMMKAREK